MVLNKKPQIDYWDDKGMYKGVIPGGWLSHPEKGKHICFDGKLLHGAPGMLARPE
jgi:hypothetical protein